MSAARPDCRMLRSVRTEAVGAFRTFSECASCAFLTLTPQNARTTRLTPIADSIKSTERRKASGDR